MTARTETECCAIEGMGGTYPPQEQLFRSPFRLPHADFHSSLARDHGRIDALLDSLTAGDRLVVSGQSPWCCAGPDLE